MFCSSVKVNDSQVEENVAQTVAGITGWGGMLVEEGEDREQTKHMWALAWQDSTTLESYHNHFILCFHDRHDCPNDFALRLLEVKQGLSFFL